MWVILQMDHLKRLERNWPAEVRYGFELSESKSCPEVFIRLEVFSQFGMECCLVLVCRAALPALEPLQFTAAVIMFPSL